MSDVAYLVMDVESVADGELVSRLRYPDGQLSAADAIARYRQELIEKYDSDFIPYTFQLPVSVAVAKVAHDLRLIDVAVLDAPQYRPHVITEHFWRGWQAYGFPTLVTFNGRGFDLPLMELAAFRFGLSVPSWFRRDGRSYQQPRNRFNFDAHLDLHDLLTNFGASRFVGGLNLAANLLGKPGKMDVQGHMVQDMHDRGEVAQINDYCRCDVLDTYFVFLRSRVLEGQLTLDAEQRLVEETRSWLTEQAESQPAYQLYLQRWGDWPDPWKSQPADDSEATASPAEATPPA